MKLDVDQSVRMEELSKNSVVGIANSKMQYAVVVPRGVKRHFKEKLRRQGKPRQFPPTIFAAAIVTCFRACNINSATITIDTEYDGYEQLIEGFILHHFPECQVEFRRIGRHSPAHLVAYAVFRRRRKPDKVLGRAEIDLVISNKKTAGESHRHVLTQVRQSNQPFKMKYTKRK